MKLLLTGASGQLGHYLLQELRGSAIEFCAWSRNREDEVFDKSLTPVDLATDPSVVEAAYHRASPDVILHAAAVTTTAAAYKHPERTHRINTHATKQLLELASTNNARFVFVSTDLVFDGQKGEYHERDTPAPLSIYGKTKFAAEQVVAQYPHHLIARLSLLYGPALNGRPAFFDHQLRAMSGQGSCSLFTDEWRTPLSYATAAQGLLGLTNSPHTGTVHLGGPERMNRYDMGMRIAHAVGANTNHLVATRQADLEFPEPRPHDVSLDSSRWRSLCPHSPWPTLESAVSQFLQQSNQ